MRALAVINPAAGGGRAGKVWPAVRPRLIAAGWHVTDVTGAGPQAVQHAEIGAREGYEVILAVGGDGTAHWAANGILRAGVSAPPALGVVPAGTGVDFAAALGLPKNTSGAVDALLRGGRRRIDVGRMNALHFLTIGMVGFGAEVARQINEWPRPLPGPVMYIAGVLKMLVAYNPTEMEVTLDGVPRRERLFMVAVGNSHRAAGGMKLCPGAAPDDGLFEVVLIGDVTKGEVLRLLPKTFSGGHIGHPKVQVVTASAVTIDSTAPLAVQGDGELAGTVPATFTVIPQALEVLAPAR
ncbi:MAG TPA: diacylglycerol kinase family protein [bacterium]|nr:diacylglycerol kinase family protein [bacterium]